MNDPTTIPTSIIQLAYETVIHIPSQESFRRGKKKKNENPAKTAPVLNRVITHLDKSKDFAWGKDKARQLVLSKNAAAYINALQSTVELKEFLAALSLFLQTTETKDRAPMNAYQSERDDTLTPEQIAERAWVISQDIPWSTDLVMNKLIRMSGRIRGAQGKWECLAVLAQYYPLRGISQALINRLVDELGKMDFTSFQAVVSQLLVFYNAASIKSKRNKAA